MTTSGLQVSSLGKSLLVSVSVSSVLEYRIFHVTFILSRSSCLVLFVHVSVSFIFTVNMISESVAVQNPFHSVSEARFCCHLISIVPSRSNSTFTALPASRTPQSPLMEFSAAAGSMVSSIGLSSRGKSLLRIGRSSRGESSLRIRFFGSGL